MDKEKYIWKERNEILHKKVNRQMTEIKEPELKQSDTQREEKMSKRIASCIMSVLRFWRLCRTKKKKEPISK